MSSAGTAGQPSRRCETALATANASGALVVRQCSTVTQVPITMQALYSVYMARALNMCAWPMHPIRCICFAMNPTAEHPLCTSHMVKEHTQTGKGVGNHMQPSCKPCLPPYSPPLQPLELSSASPRPPTIGLCQVDRVSSGMLVTSCHCHVQKNFFAFAFILSLASSACMAASTACNGTGSTHMQCQPASVKLPGNTQGRVGLLAL